MIGVRGVLTVVVVAIGAASFFIWSQDQVDSETQARITHKALVPEADPQGDPYYEIDPLAPDVGMGPHAFAPSEEVIDGDTPPPDPTSEAHFQRLDEMVQGVEEDLRTLDERIAAAEAAPDPESNPELARLRSLREKITRDLEMRRWAVSIDRARAEGRDIPPPPFGHG